MCGAYKDVKAVEKMLNIEGMDAHHVGQKAVMEKMVQIMILKQLRLLVYQEWATL